MRKYIFYFVFLILPQLMQAQNEAQLKREMEVAMNESWNRLIRNTVRPASFRPKAWKMTMQGHLGNNELLFVSKLDCNRAINTLINDMVNVGVRTTSKYSSYTPSQSEIREFRNTLTNTLNCDCKEVDNPNYNPETSKSMVDYSNPYSTGSLNKEPSNDISSGNSNLLKQESSQIQGSVFDAPSRRGREVISTNQVGSIEDNNSRINTDININSYFSSKQAPDSKLEHLAVNQHPQPTENDINSIDKSNSNKQKVNGENLITDDMIVNAIQTENYGEIYNVIVSEGQKIRKELKNRSFDLPINKRENSIDTSEGTYKKKDVNYSSNPETNIRFGNSAPNSARIFDVPSGRNSLRKNSNNTATEINLKDINQYISNEKEKTSGKSSTF